MKEKYDIFLSHSTGDNYFANELYYKLTNRGLRCFKSDKSLKSGERWLGGINEALKQSTYIIF